MKHDWKPGPMIYPLPVAIISCGKDPDEYNLFTVSWLGTLSSEPPMCYISIKPKRHSHAIIKRDMEFVINLATHDLAFATDRSGLITGREHKKFEELGLTPERASVVGVPTIRESPVNIECRVKVVLSMGSHDIFISEIINLRIDEKLIEEESERIDLSKTDLIAFSYGNYYQLGNVIGKYGWSKEK